MGGNRCYFRDCHVSSAKFPGMHFFRFPLKDPVRYKKWLQLSKMEHSMPKFPEVRRKNTCICARHFRIECFMNYKMNRLAPSAIPTIMRLSADKAIDFELDIENGVLVTLRKTESKHLIPPDDFECPLSLMNDRVLLELLNELQSKQYCSNIDTTHRMNSTYSDKSVEYEEIMEIPERTLHNSVKILETIQVVAPNSKRSAQIDDDEIPSSSASNKKCRILTITYAKGENGAVNTTAGIVACRSTRSESCEINSDELEFIESDHIEDTSELENNEQTLLTSEVFINGVSNGTEDIEFFEVHKHGNSLHYELPLTDSDATIAELKSDKQQDAVNQELLELKKKCKDFDMLQVRLSLLKTENKELKKTCKETEDINKKLLLLQMENSRIKKDYESLKEKLQNYSHKNNTLIGEVAGIAILKTEIAPKNEKESKGLGNLTESIRTVKSIDKEERSINISKTTKLKEELEVLKEKLQHELRDKESQLTAVKGKLSQVENEKNIISQQKENLERSLQNIQNSFDISQNDYKNLKSDFDNLHQKHALLEEKYCKLQTIQNHESTVSTFAIKTESDQAPALPAVLPVPTNPLNKAQLFHGIRRYLSASMVSLLRMEMFGSSEREWKSDERQVAVDILRLGEMVYKYFTDEWRIRLPALRDVRNWLSQSQLISDEEDL